MHMVWDELLFAHWPFPPEAIAPLIPASLTLDTWEGAAWIGVVPFRMRGVRPRGIPSLPGISAFPELNVRTYVVADGKPGVWFFSLDASSRFAVRAARLGFHLPYMDAQIAFERVDHIIHYRSQRTHRGEPRAELDITYSPTGPPRYARSGTLEFWFTARYCLYAQSRRGQLFRGEIDHPPWPLQPAMADIHANSMLAPLGLGTPAAAPRLHYAESIGVRAWTLDRVESPSTA